jgi:hypothetical protein
MFVTDEAPGEGAGSGASARLQPKRPTVYLDQWAWIRLSSTLLGKPQQPGDAELLTEVWKAAEAGVAFPLSATHYIETRHTLDPSKRLELANVMGLVSHFRTLRAPTALLREQLLATMHEHFGRPAFRPERTTPLGLGSAWALTGELPDGRLDEVRQRSGWGALSVEQACRCAQFVELRAMGGPLPDEEPILRAQYGYRPEASRAVAEARLQAEREFAAAAEKEPEAKTDLRYWVQAREVVHERLDLIAAGFIEYGVPIRKLSGGTKDPQRRREFISAFFDSMPSFRTATDVKTGTHRDRTRPWERNDLYDADAMLIAVPYCDVVVADGATEDSMRRRKTGEHTGTLITGKLGELREALPDLERRAAELPNPTGWEHLVPGLGFAPIAPVELAKRLREHVAS